MSASAQKAVYLNHPYDEDVVHSEGSVQHRVLVVDEQAHILRVLRSNLDRHGYAVDMALSSEYALRLMREHHFDVLIITSDLPDMNARQLCENIDLQSALTRPLVLLGTELEESWADNAAGIECLGSPVSLKRILARLDDEFSK